MEDDTVAIDFAHHAVGLADGEGERIFAVDVFTSACGGENGDGMPVVGGGDEDGVDIIAGDELAEMDKNKGQLHRGSTLLPQ